MYTKVCSSRWHLLLGCAQHVSCLRLLAHEVCNLFSSGMAIAADIDPFERVQEMVKCAVAHLRLSGM